jgi:hypothetical protein
MTGSTLIIPNLLGSEIGIYIYIYVYVHVCIYIHIYIRIFNHSESIGF